MLLKNSENTIDYLKNSWWNVLQFPIPKEWIRTDNIISWLVLLNNRKCQFEEILMAYFNDPSSVEIEGLSPYASDYDIKNWNIPIDNLVNSDKIWVWICKIVRDLLPKAVLVSLYDEYNTDMPDSQWFMWRPTAQIWEWEWTQISMTEEWKWNFLSSIKSLLKHNLVNTDEDYLFVSESSKVESAEIFVKQLEDKWFIIRNGEEVFFINKKAENSEYKKIRLRTSKWRWLCEALDASSYLDPINLEKTHLVILPSYFEAQQDKVWEMLRCLWIEPTNYHNIFYDWDADTEKVVESIRGEFQKQLNYYNMKEAA